MESYGTAGLQHRVDILFSLLHQHALENPIILLAYCRNTFKQIEEYIFSPASQQSLSGRRVPSSHPPRHDGPPHPYALKLSTQTMLSILCL